MSKSSKKQATFIFTLRSININQINEKYGLSNTNLPEKTSSPVNTTKISELTISKNTPEVVSFLDESKKIHICKITMIDYKTRLNVNSFNYNCFWDRNPFDFRGIGCPIKYIPKQAVKSYYSEISKDFYTIKESVTNKREDSIDSNVVIDNNGDYYETDGFFCSWNCMQAFIIDNKHNPIYDQSSNLLIKMYGDMTGERNVSILSAPHWRLLEEYGGYLSIEKFRDNFNKIEYNQHGTIKCMAVGIMYEESIKF